MISLLALASWFASLATSSYEVVLDDTLSSGPFITTDQDGDGATDVVVLSDKRLWIIRKGGTERAEFAFPAAAEVVDKRRNVLIKSASDAGVAGCDLDGDKQMDFLFSSPDARVFAISGKTLKLLPGYPVSLPEAPTAPLLCGDWDHNGSNEWFAAVKVQVHAFSGKGEPIKGASLLYPKPILGLTLGAFSSASSVALIVTDELGELYHQRPGQTKEKLFLDKASQSFGFRLNSPPVLVDIDDDGEASLVGLGEDYGIAVRQAKPNPGFPVSTGYRFYSPPALGDVDGDGSIDIVAANADGKIYAVNGRGKPLPGFPINIGGRFAQVPWLIDRELDGKLEIALLAPNGVVHLRAHDGKALPELFDPFEDAGKAPAQLVATDTSYMAFVVGLHKVSVKEAPRSVRGLKDRALVCGMAMGGPSHEGRYSPNEARFADLALVPEKPKTDDVLSARYRYFDLDGDKEGTTLIRWFRNDKPVPELDNKREVPANMTSKRDAFFFTLQDEANAKAFGPSGALSRVFRSPVVKVANTVPTTPAVEITPEPALTTHTLNAVLTKPSVDADGDAITYLYRWFRSRQVLAQLPPTQASVPPDLTKKGERWSVYVVAVDGDGESLPAGAERVVLNTPPEAPVISISPTAIDTTTELVAKVDTPARDADGDRATYTYAWKVDGRPIAQAEKQNTLPAYVARKGQTVELTVTPYDNEAAGTLSSTTVKARNALPSGVALHVLPLHPRRQDTLVGHLLSAALDPDSDPVAHKASWLLDDQPTALAQGFTVPTAALKKGQRWTLVVTPSDPEGDGAVAKVSTQIVNTPPTGLKAQLREALPYVTSPIVVDVASKGLDVDGDAISVDYEWRRNGAPQPFDKSKNALERVDIKKGDVWQVTVQSRDAEQAGDKLTLGFVIRNTKPSKPDILLEPAAPRTEQSLEVKLRQPSVDVDADALSYRYRYYLDGVRADFPEHIAMLKPGSVKRGVRLRVEVSAFDGEVESEPVMAETVWANTTPTAPIVALQGKTVEQSLDCSTKLASQDFDHDTVQLRYEWLLNGNPYNSSGSSIPKVALRRGQKWSCRAQAYDQESSSAWSEFSALTLENAAPSAPKVVVESKSNTVRDDLRCVLATPSFDSDGDTVTYRYAWKKRGSGEVVEGATIPKQRLKRGDIWSCSVTALDGQGSAATATAADATIGNATPSQPGLRFLPEQPSAGDQLSCEVATPSSDPDGDKIDYRFAWFKDGVEQRFASTTTTVPGRLVKKGETWSCSVVAADGVAAAAAVVSELAAVH